MIALQVNILWFHCYNLYNLLMDIKYVKLDTQFLVIIPLKAFAIN